MAGQRGTHQSTFRFGTSGLAVRSGGADEINSEEVDRLGDARVYSGQGIQKVRWRISSENMAQGRGRTCLDTGWRCSTRGCSSASRSMGTAEALETMSYEGAAHRPFCSADPAVVVLLADECLLNTAVEIRALLEARGRWCRHGRYKELPQEEYFHR